MDILAEEDLSRHESLTWSTIRTTKDLRETKKIEERMA